MSFVVTNFWIFLNHIVYNQGADVWGINNLAKESSLQLRPSILLELQSIT